MKTWKEDCKYLTFTVGNFIQVKIYSSNFIGNCFVYISDAHNGDEFKAGTPEQMVEWLNSRFLLLLESDELEIKIKKFLEDEIERSKIKKNAEVGD